MTEAGIILMSNRADDLAVAWAVVQAENPQMTFDRRMAAAATPTRAPWVAKNARLRVFPLVGHYDFLADCTGLVDCERV